MSLMNRPALFLTPTTVSALQTLKKDHFHRWSHQKMSTTPCPPPLTSSTCRRVMETLRVPMTTRPDLNSRHLTTQAEELVEVKVQAEEEAEQASAGSTTSQEAQAEV